MSRDLVWALTLLIVSFAFGYVAKWQTLSDPSRPETLILTEESHADLQSSERPLREILAGVSDTATWLTYHDVLSGPSVPWRTVLHAAAQDTELQKLVCLHWSRRDAKGCWDHLRSMRSSLQFEDLAPIALRGASPSEAIHWPDDDCDAQGRLRWGVFRDALARDMERAFALAYHVADYWGGTHELDSRWAQGSPRRAIELIGQQPPPIRNTLLPTAAYALAQEDVAEATRWVTTLEPAGTRRAALRGLGQWLADEADPPKKVEHLVSPCRSLEEREVILRPLLEKWQASDPPRADSLIKEHLQGSSAWRRLMRRREQAP